MDYLARRELAFRELELKLRINFPNYQESKVKDVVTALQRENLQSDKRFVESYCRYRKGKGFGYKHIRNILSLKRIAADEINNQLCPEDPDWVNIATNVLRRKMRAKSPIKIEKPEVHKLTRFMKNRGFSASQIKEAFKLLED